MPTAALTITESGADAPARRSGWHNRLPAWIEQDGPYLRLPTQYVATLQVIANRCDPAKGAGGDLLVCFGGGGLAKACHCSMRTLWRRLSRLESLGYVVAVGRGGAIQGRSYANIYGVPGLRGSLDHRRARRQSRPMVLGEDGVWRPNVLDQGEQAQFWPDNSKHHSRRVAGSPTRGTPRRPNVEIEGAGGVPVGSDGAEPGGGGTVSVTVGHCQSVTLPSPIPPHKKTIGCVTRGDHGGSRELVGGPSSLGGFQVVTPADLSDTQALIDLHARLMGRPWSDTPTNDRIRYLAAAEHASRVGKDPPALFASLCHKRSWLFITPLRRETGHPTPLGRGGADRFDRFGSEARSRGARGEAMNPKKPGELWGIYVAGHGYRKWCNAVLGFRTRFEAEQYFMPDFMPEHFEGCRQAVVRIAPTHSEEYLAEYRAVMLDLLQDLMSDIGKDGLSVAPDKRAKHYKALADRLAHLTAKRKDSASKTTNRSE